MSQTKNYSTIARANQGGQEKQFRQAAATNKSAATTEEFKTQQKVKWFACNDVQYIRDNMLALRRLTDERPTDVDAMVYNKFTLLQYACVFDRLDVLKLTYQNEKDSLCQEALTIQKNNTSIEIPAGTTPLQLAILCNSTKCTQYLLEQLTVKDVRIPLNELGETTSVVCARLPEYEAAHVALLFPLLQTKEFFYETEKTKNVVLAACESRNEFLMHLFTQLLATANAKHLQRFALTTKVTTSPECQNYLTVLQISALERVVAEKLFDVSEWEAALKVYYDSDADQKLQQLRDNEQARDEERAFMAKYASCRPPANNKNVRVNKLTGQSSQPQKYTVSNRPLYDFSARQPVQCKEFELQAEQVQVQVQQQAISEEAAEKPEAVEEKTNLFDNRPESQIPVLISQYGNCFQISRPEQLAAARNFASDDRVVPLTQAQVNWFNVCKEGNIQLVRSMIRTHVNEVDTRATDPENLIFNGFSGIHYAVVFGRWQVVEHLMTYEALATTKARVILKAPGIAQDRAVVVPLQSNCLQLACYANQVQIVKLIVDNLIQPKKQMIDPVQVAFSQHKPLTQAQQKKLLSLKNELEYTALAVLAQCKALCTELCKNLEKENYILQICLDQLEDDDILEYNDQFVVQNAYIFNNAYVIKTLRTELLSNPCKKMNNDVFSKLLFKIYDLIQDMKNGLECKEVLESMSIKEDVQSEMDTLTKQIQAQWYIDRQKEDAEADLPENQMQDELPEELRFKKHFQINFENYDSELQTMSDDVNDKLEFLKEPKYVDDFGGEVFVKLSELENKQGDLEYLDSVIQPQDVSYYFDCIILGYTEFVRSEAPKFLRQIDRRQTNKQVINGFTGLLYACYYGHLGIVKILLRDEYDVRQGGQIKVQVDKDQIYIFDQLVNCYHAAVLSKSADAQAVIDYITEVASKESAVAASLFWNHKASSDILKLAVRHQHGYVFGNKLVRFYESQHIYKQLQDRPLSPTILYTICQNQSIDGVMFLQDIILSDSLATRAETDIPQETKMNIESELLFSLQLACLQRIDGKCPLDHIRAVVVDAEGNPVKQDPKQAAANSVAVKLINDLTNDGIMRALTAQFDELAQQLLQQYYGEQLSEIQKKFEEEGDYLSGRIVHKVRPNSVDELQKTNFFLEEYQINRITFQPIQKLNEIDIWFEMCKHGTLQQVQQIARNFIGRRELRYNNYELEVNQGFTGLMYATLYNSLDVILFLMDHEAMYNLEQDAVIRTKSGPYFINAGATPLHVAAIGAEQYVIDAFFQFFFEHEYDIVSEISVSRFLIIHNKSVQMEQLIKDFTVDDQLLRLAVQYARVEFLNAMGKMSYTQEYFERFYAQLFKLFQYKDYMMTTNDLIWLLPSQTWAKLPKQDVNDTITFVELSIKKVVITMIQQNTLSDNSQLLNDFFKDQNATEKIQQSFKTLSDPEVIPEEIVDTVSREQFFRIQDDQITEQPEIIQLQMQTELTDRWFAACRDNDMSFVHKYFKDMKMSRDGRKQSFINRIHTGFCGLHYAIIYGAADVFSFLFDFEWNVITGSDTIINGDQGRYYVPARSTILHLIAMVRNDQFLGQMKVKPQIENLVNAKNKLDITPIEVFSGQNYCAQYLFDMFLFNLNDTEMREEAEGILGVCFENCCKQNANNVDFAKFSVKNSSLYESLIYKHVFKIIQDDCQTDAAQQFLTLQNEALEYALLYRMEDQWRRLLDERYGSEKAAVEEEYQQLKILQTEQYELVENEKMYEEPELIITPAQNIREPPTLKYLRESKMTREELDWFDACKTGNCQYIKKHIKLAGIQDQCITNYIEKKYTQFTGLMYAIVYGQMDVCKLLAKQELLIYAKAKNLVEIPYDYDEMEQDHAEGQEGPVMEKRYFLTRTCFPVLLAIICHQYEIFDYFVDQLKTQDELIYNQYMYEQMVACDYRISYDYMIKLMMANQSNINYLQLAYIFRKDSHMKYLLDFLTDQNDPVSPDGARAKEQLQLIKDYKFDEIIYRQQLSVLSAANIQQWRGLGENTDELINVSIDYGLDNSHDPEIMQYLLKIFEDEAEPKIKEHHNARFHSGLVKDMSKVIHNSYVITDLQDEVAEDCKAEYRPKADMEQEDVDRLGHYLDAVKDNNMPVVKKLLFDNVGKCDSREYDLEAEVFPGFCALHYAVYKNNVPMIGILWNQEKYCLTKTDVVISALGTGYGNHYLLSKGSNSLMIAVLQDNVEAVQMIVNLISADRKLLDFYQRPNMREQNNLYIASVCWRCNAAQIVYESKFMRTYLRQIVLQKDPKTIPIIHTLMFTNCAYGAKILYDWSVTDLQFMQWFYQVILKYDYTVMKHRHDKQTYGTESDMEYLQTWMDVIYEDALNYALKQNAEINWNRMLEENLGPDLKDLVVKQYTQYRVVTVRNGQIEIFDTVLQQRTVQKVRALEQKNAMSGASVSTGAASGQTQVDTSVTMKTRRSFNIEGQGKFNETLNQTTIDDVSRLRLPQQEILGKPQIVLKQAPDKAAKSTEKVDNLERLWGLIEEGK